MRRSAPSEFALAFGDHLGLPGYTGDAVSMKAIESAYGAFKAPVSVGHLSATPKPPSPGLNL